MPQGKNQYEQYLDKTYVSKEHFLVTPLTEKRTATIFYQTYYPNESIRTDKKRHLLYVHGMNSYGGRMASFVEDKFLKRGFTVSLMDLPGFGRSDGKCHGLVYSFQDLVLGVNRVVSHLRDSHAENDRIDYLIAYGTSMGAQILIRYQVQFEQSHGIDAFILGSPFLQQIARKVPPLPILWMLRLLSYVFPSMPFLPRKPLVFPKDPEMEKMYRSDPFIYNGGMRLGTAFAVLDALKDLPGIVEKFRGCPFLIQMGEKDT